MLAWAAMFLGYYHIHVMCFIPNRHFFNFILPIELKQTKSRANSFSSVEQKSRASSFSSEEQKSPASSFSSVEHSKEREKKMKISISLYETGVFVLILVSMFGLEKIGFHWSK